MGKERNLGIDLLRIVSMLLIVMRHLLGFGGILENVELFSLNYSISWFLDACAECAVNCYALITGYVYAESKYKYSNILNLWFQVLFYTVGITMLFFMISPETFSMKTILLSFLPVTGRRYWYFTAYFGMFFFIPFFNHLLNTLTGQQLKNMFFTIIILFSIIPTLCHSDLFHTADGYSVLWLSLMYLLGGCIKKNPSLMDLSKYRTLMLYFTCILITWSSKWGIQFITLRLFAKPNNGTMLMLYTSPTMIFAAIALLILFSKIKIQRSKKIITFFSPLVFGVYLIHNNEFIRESVLKDSLITFASSNPFILLATVFTATILIYFVCSLIDLMRTFLFNMLKIKKFSNLISLKISNSFNNLSES